MSNPPRPVALPVQPENIPDELKALPQWVTWRYVWLEDRQKWDKPPRNARTGRAASSTNRKTWSPYADALHAYKDGDLDGIGLAVTEENTLVGIDLDHGRNPDTGEIAPWAWAIARRLNSYTEISPSGTGLRIWLKATRNPKGRRKGHIEVYSWGRYLTVTGWHIGWSPATIEPRQAELEAFEAELAVTPQTPRPTSPPTNGHGPHLSDDDLIEKALAARNRGKFARLWSGDTSDYDGDDSRADLALCSALTFWTQDEAQIDRIFRRSGLYREKWERADYREATIAKAMTTIRRMVTGRPGTARPRMIARRPRTQRRTRPTPTPALSSTVRTRAGPSKATNRRDTADSSETTGSGSSAASITRSCGWPSMAMSPVSPWIRFGKSSPLTGSR
jgi:putative DNA primase/helicase